MSSIFDNLPKPPPPPRIVHLSPCETYRYLLARTWSDHPVRRLWVVMVNPSYADDQVDDPTIQRLTGFAKRWGYGGIAVVNLFALRSSDPAALDTHEDPAGPANSSWLLNAITSARADGEPLLCAWGNNGARWQKGNDFARMAKAQGASLVCLGLTEAGHPKHPLARGEHRIQDDFEPIPFEPRDYGVAKVGHWTLPLNERGEPTCARCAGRGRLTLEEQCWKCAGTGVHPNPAAGPIGETP